MLKPTEYMCNLITFSVTVQGDSFNLQFTSDISNAFEGFRLSYEVLEGKT